MDGATRVANEGDLVCDGMAAFLLAAVVSGSHFAGAFMQHILDQGLA